MAAPPPPRVELVTPPPPPEDGMRMLAAWAWLLPPRLALVAVNRFGDWYVITPDSAIHRLAIWEGTLTEVAPSPEAWRAWLATDAGLAANHAALVPALFDRGLRLDDGRVFAFVPPPLDGVGIDPARIKPISLAAITSIMGQTHQQRQRAERPRGKRP
jgi:hypothetical protein